MEGRDITHARLDAVHDMIEIYRQAWDLGSHHNYERHMLGELLTGLGPTEERLNAYARKLLRGTTDGFIALNFRGHLELTMEYLVADTTRSYHGMWDKDLVNIANTRLANAQADKAA